jgi:hypothetical protein
MTASTQACSLRLTEPEREALVAILYVVKDNWWLTDVEERLLQRLELLDEEPAPQLAA